MTASERQRAEIYAAYGLTCPPRFATLRDPSRKTYGPRIAEQARMLGMPFMPHQRYIADVIGEVDPTTGLLYYRNIGVTMMRQCGKTALLLPWYTWRGQAWPMQHSVYAAQNQTSARKKWKHGWIPVLEQAQWVPKQDQKLLPRHRAKVRREHGDEGFLWRRTNSVFMLHAGTERAGHGDTLHQGGKDEYFAAVDTRIDAAWDPAMITVPDAQNSWWSTAGTSRSVPMNEEVRRGRELVQSGEPTRSAYFEWSRPPDADRADRGVWLATIPALCPDPVCHCSAEWRHTITVAALAAELEKANTKAKLADFDRAYGNIPREDDAPDGDPNVPTVEQWDTLARPDLEGTGTEERRPLACAIDVTPSGDAAAIVAVGEGPDGPSGPPVVVVLEHGPGTGWVPAAARRYDDELRPVAWALDPRSQAKVLRVPLENAKIRPPRRRTPNGDEVPGVESDRKRGDLWTPDAGELGESCARLTTLSRPDPADPDGPPRLYHLGQKAMRAAVANARTRMIGDGLFAFARRASAGDISPWCAAAVALGAFERFRHLAAERDYDLLESIG